MTYWDKLTSASKIVFGVWTIYALYMLISRKSNVNFIQWLIICLFGYLFFVGITQLITAKNSRKKNQSNNFGGRILSAAEAAPEAQTKKKRSGCLTVIIIVILLATIAPSNPNIKVDEKETSGSNTNVDVGHEHTIAPSTAELSEEEVFINFLLSNPDVAADAAHQTYKLLTSDLGFSSIVAEENKSGTIFKVIADNYILTITVSDKPYMIICGDYNMYRDDTIHYTKQDLDDRHIGNNDTAYYVIAKEIVSSYLIAPSTASFASIDKCSMGRNKEYVVVQGSVEAANAYGVPIVNNYVVEFRVIDLSVFSYEIVYVNINGESTGTYIDIK